MSKCIGVFQRLLTLYLNNKTNINFFVFAATQQQLNLRLKNSSLVFGTNHLFEHWQSSYGGCNVSMVLFEAII